MEALDFILIIYLLSQGRLVSDLSVPTYHSAISTSILSIIRIIARSVWKIFGRV